MTGRSSSPTALRDGDGGGVLSREEIRGWLVLNFPPSLQGADGDSFLRDRTMARSHRDYGLFVERMAARGWIAPTWPLRYGGAGLDAGGARILLEELAAVGGFLPEGGFGPHMIGPTLLQFGSEDQKARFLPPIAAGKMRWCQGFSEPGAGSDLAAVATRCVDAGDVWRVTGQKLWTSTADEADWIFALVRTDAADKHGGLSLVLIAMDSPGITVRPIELIDGSADFCEVFFDEVVVPKDHMVGNPGDGWQLAQYILGQERTTLAGEAEVVSLAPVAHANLGTDESGRIDAPDLRNRLIRHRMREVAFAELSRQYRSGVDIGARGVEASVVKNLWSAIAQERAELAVEIHGSEALVRHGEGYEAEASDVVRHWLYSRCYSIYGGSYEIQSNIIARNGLGLPSR